MVSRRFAPALVAAALAIAPGLALAGIPVVVYPFRVPGLSAAQRSDLHGILEAGLASSSRRGILTPRSPVLLPMICGDRPASACLVDAAKGAVVLTGRGEIRSGVVLVTATLCDSKGTRTREVRFLLDLVIQNLRPVSESLRELEAELGPDGLVPRDERSPAIAQAAPPAVAAAPPAKPSLSAIPLPPPPVSASPGKAAVATRAPAPQAGAPHWKRKAGPWLTGVGLALVAGGAAVGILNRDLADDLDARYASGRLTSADRSSYDRVEFYNVVSTSLFAIGGATAAAGAWIWISAPAAGQPAAVGAGGRF